MTLKSAATPNEGSKKDAAHAVLCTESQTFQVLQVQSSNSVFVVQPNEGPKPLDSDETPVTSLRAIAKCPNMLELVATKPAAVDFLKQHLPLYLVEYIASTKDSETVGPSGKRNKVEVLGDAPFSSGEFEEAWTQVCAFENGQAAWIPPSALLLKGWEIILTAATIKGLELHDTFPTAAITNLADEDGFPLELIEAILARVSAGNQKPMGGHAMVDRAKCVFWVGSICLDSLGSEVLVSKFLEQWRDKLPEKWRGEASLDKLKVCADRFSLIVTNCLFKGSYRQTAPATVIYDEKANEKEAAAVEIAKASTGRAKPNWHEKFRNTKK